MKDHKNTSDWGKSKAAERYARGGAVKVTVNVNKASDQKPPMPMPIPMPPPGPPPGLPPGGPPPGMGAPGPGGMKRGGVVRPSPAVHMTAGAASGVGRLQKIKAYGGKRGKD